MAFTPKDWRNKPDATTPLSAAALEDMETRLSAYTDSRAGTGQVGGTAQSVVPTQVKTGDYQSQPGQQVPVDATGGPMTVTLPSRPSDGAEVEITQVTTVDGPVTIAAQDGDAIGGPGAPSSSVLKPGEQSLLRYLGNKSPGAFAPKILSTPNLVSYWRLNDTSGAMLDTKSALNGTYGGYVEMVKGTSGLVAYWRLNEAVGATSAADSKGAHTLTPAAPGAWETGRSGIIGSDTSAHWPLSFNATLTDAVPGPVLGNKPAWTIEAWIKTTDLGGYGRNIWNEADISGKNLLHLGVNNGKLQLLYRDEPDTSLPTGNFLYRVGSAMGVADGAWHHVVGYRNQNEMGIYIDGVQVPGAVMYPGNQGDNPNIFPSITTNFPVINGIVSQVGGSGSDPNYLFDGNMQSVALYNVALPPSTISGHAAASGPQPGVGVKPGALAPSGDLGSCVHLGTPATVSDASAHRLTGDLSIACWVKPDSLSGITAILSKWSSGAGYEFGTSGNHLYFKSNSSTVTDSANLELNAWQYVAVTLQGSAVNFYINGVPGGSGSATPPTATATALLVGAATPSAAPFGGQMQELSLFNAALSAASIASQYGAGTAASTGVWYTEQAVDVAGGDRRYRLANSPSLNIKEYPYLAVGDGTTDDYPAFQRALNDLNGPGTIEIPPGTYWLASAIAPMGYVLFHGSGDATGGPTLLWKGGAGSGPMIQIWDASGVGLEQLELKFTDLHYDSNLVDLNHSARWADVIGFRAERCSFRGTGYEHPHVGPVLPKVGGGTFAAGSYWWTLTANYDITSNYDVAGESTGPDGQWKSASIAANGSAEIQWLPTQNVESYNVYRWDNSAQKMKRVASNLTPEFNFWGEWSVNSTYPTGAIVTRFGAYYISLQDNNLYANPGHLSDPGNAMVTPTTWWKRWYFTWTDTGVALGSQVPPHPSALLGVNYAIIDTIRDCSFNGYCDYGIYFGPNYVNNIQLEGCTFNNSRASLIRIESGDIESFNVRGCTFEGGFGGDAAIDGRNSGFYSITIDGCWFGDYGGSDYWLKDLYTIGNWGVGILRGNHFYEGPSLNNQWMCGLAGTWLVEGNLFYGSGRFFQGRPRVLIGNSFNGSTTQLRSLARYQGEVAIGNSGLTDYQAGPLSIGTNVTGGPPSSLIDNYAGQGSGFIFGATVGTNANPTDATKMLRGLNEATIYGSNNTASNNISPFRMQSSNNGELQLVGDPGGGGDPKAQVRVNGTGVGFYGGNPVTKPSLTYSRAGETAGQTQLRQALVALGLAADNTTA